MENNNNHNDDLRAIRKIMEESSRFLSLSGLSGIFIGVFALAGATIAWFLIRASHPGIGLTFQAREIGSGTAILIGLIAMIVLIAALTTAYIFARQRSKKNNIVFWGPVTKRLLFNLSIPLLFGALFILVLIVNNNPEYIVSASLCFYGMALLNAGKFTFDEVQYLGIFELVLGIFAGFFTSFGLLWWLVGFGLLHIMYGIILHRKYN